MQDVVTRQHDLTSGIESDQAQCDALTVVQQQEVVGEQAGPALGDPDVRAAGARTPSTAPG